MDDFRGVCANYMYTKNFVRIPIGYNLDFTGYFIFGVSFPQRSQWKSTDGNIVIL